VVDPDVVGLPDVDPGVVGARGEGVIDAAGPRMGGEDPVLGIGVGADLGHSPV